MKLKPLKIQLCDSTTTKYTKYLEDKVRYEYREASVPGGDQFVLKKSQPLQGNHFLKMPIVDPFAFKYFKFLEAKAKHEPIDTKGGFDCTGVPKPKVKHKRFAKHVQS
jgi:hypothetical protein